MESPSPACPALTIVAQAGVVLRSDHPDDAVERAFAAAADPDQVGDLLDALVAGRLWLPLAADGRPVTDGSAVHLPMLSYLGCSFVPAYTSAARLMRAAEERTASTSPEPDRGSGRAVLIPHAVVAAADLARRLPRPVGIALNPGAAHSVPVYPAGVAHLAALWATVGGRRTGVGPLPAAPADLLTAIRAGLSRIPAAREATAAWLTVPGAGEGMVVSVGLDEPGNAASREWVVAALAEAAAVHGPAWPVDVTFPGEGEPDLIDRWTSSFGVPFYQRDVPVSLPAQRPPSA